MAHSPAPWSLRVTTVKRGKVISEDVERFAVVADNGDIVCGGKTALRDDDGTLIAEAPALLTALRRLVNEPEGSLRMAALSEAEKVLKRLEAL